MKKADSDMHTPIYKNMASIIIDEHKKENIIIHEVRELLKINPNLNLSRNLEDYAGQTFLHLAVKRQLPELVSFLLWAGANPLVRDHEGHRCVDFIVHKKSMQKKLNKAFQIKSLHDLVGRGDLFSIFACVRAGFDINIRNPQGDSPLMVAAANADENLVLFFCNQTDIEMNVLNKNQENALLKALQKFVTLCTDTTESQTEEEKKSALNCVKILVAAKKSINRYQRNHLGQNLEDLLKPLYDKKYKNELKDIKAAIIAISPYQKFGSWTNISKEQSLAESYSEEEPLLDKEIIQTLDLDRISIPPETERDLPSGKIQKDYYSQIAKTEKEWEFIRCLSNLGLQPTCPTSDVRNFNELDFSSDDSDFNCLSATWQLCMGAESGETLWINEKDIYIKTLGLLGYFDPCSIMHSLMRLSAYFSNHQHLVGHMLVKNMIYFSHEFHKNINSSHFKTLLTEYATRYCLLETGEILLEFHKIMGKFIKINKASFKKESSPRFFDQDFFEKINTVIRDNNKYVEKEALWIAHTMASLTGEFYQKFPLDCLGKQAEGPDLQNPQMRYKEMFSRMRFWIEFNILQYLDKNHRAKALSLYIHVAKTCLHLKPVPDTNMFLLILLALETSAITRLKNTFSLLDPQTVKIFEGMKKLASVKDNFSSLHAFCNTWPDAFPSLVMIENDIALVQEKKELHDLFDYGNIYYKILNLKKQISGEIFEAAPIRTSLLSLNLPEQERREDLLLTLSRTLEPLRQLSTFFEQSDPGFSEKKKESRRLIEIYRQRHPGL